MNDPSNISPPRWPWRLLRRVLNPNYWEELEGDLEERFYEDVQIHGHQKARRRYIWGAIKLLRPALVKKLSGDVRLNQYGMFRHNFLITLRSFKRHRVTFLINLIGLSTGLASVLLIYLWVYGEISIDKFHEKDQQLYQVLQNLSTPNGVRTIEGTQGILAEALAAEMPEVEQAVPVMTLNNRQGVLSVNNRRIKARAQFAGPDFFNIFSYRLIHGDKDKVLSEKYGVVISKELCIKLFDGTDDVIGKTITWHGRWLEGPYQISGIVDNPPASSSVQLDLLFNYDLLLEKRPDLQLWSNADPYTYVVLKDGVNVDLFNEKIADFVQRKHEESIASLFLRRYSDKYLYDTYENGELVGGRIEYVKMFSAIALFILVIACVNFMNLSTAKSSRRIKEIGIKKAIGARRKVLIFQHLAESTLMAFVSLAVAILLVALLLPQFNDITGGQLTLNFEWNFVLLLIGATLVTGLLSGSYPALYLSNFDPAVTLKGKSTTPVAAVSIRRGLVIFQFILSVAFIVAVLVVQQQMAFVQSKPLGYDRDNILYFDRDQKLSGGSEAFLAEIRNLPGVVQASSIRVGLIGSGGGFGGGGLVWPGKSPDNTARFWRRDVDYDLIETLGIELVAGRTFSPEFGAESASIVCNEAAIETMGLENPIGQTVKLWDHEKRIIGVVKNFHFESFYEEVKPMFFRRYPNLNRVMVKIKGGTEKETIEQLSKLYEAFNQGLSFDYSFLDEVYQAQYTAEQRVASLSRYFAVVAILISCLGLFGLAAFTAERRSKEIGIRKVLGSSALRIVYLLSGDFTKMVLTAVVITLPLSYLLADNWLAGFAYHFDMDWRIFAGSGALALLIAWLTVSLQTIKAAISNPVDALRNE